MPVYHEINEDKDYDIDSNSNNYSVPLFQKRRKSVLVFCCCNILLFICYFSITLSIILPIILHKNNTLSNDFNIDSITVGVVVDMGSSGTRISIYGWSKNDIVQNLPFGHSHSYSSKKSRAISNDNSKNIDIIDDLLDYAVNHLTDLGVSISKTYLYMYGTQGLRNMNPDDADIALTHISEFVQENYNFILNDDWIGILSGQEEALYDWITVQQTQLICNEYDKIFPYITPFDYLYDNSIIENMGIMDMGGSSLEISFIPDYIPDRNDNIDNTTFSNIQYQNKDYSIYAVSYPDLGHNTVPDRYQEILETNAIDDKIYDPCLQEGAKYHKTSLSGDKKYKLTGTGNIDECISYINQIIESDNPCLYNNCGAEGKYQPFVNTSLFLAFSYFNDITYFLKCGGICTLQQLQELSHEYCSLSWDEADSKYDGSKIDTNKGCLMGLYVTQLLTSTLGFNVNTNQIIFIDTIYNNNELSWTLGYITNKQQYI